MSSSSQSNAAQSRPGWHAFFAEAIRLFLAPLILFLGGFFTSSFLISGQYTWPRTSRVFALTLTAVILSYEFVYKEQLTRQESAARARISVLYSCAIPYLLGAALMLLLWKL